jgi:hypothetical protein
MICVSQWRSTTASNGFPRRVPDCGEVPEAFRCQENMRERMGFEGCGVVPALYAISRSAVQQENAEIPGLTPVVAPPMERRI